MDFIFIFLEGIASFISPCLLPMLPIYISYFIGKEEKSTYKTILNSIGFVLGFSLVFIVLSLFASIIGNIISTNLKYIQIVFGSIVILLGLNYMEIIKINFINNIKKFKTDTTNLNFIKSLLFGIGFSVSWTPCIGIFLSSALLLIAKQQDVFKGVLLMIVYSIGLGIPFIISVVLIEKLKTIFDLIKKNYKKVKIFSGIILIFMGLYLIFF